MRSWVVCATAVAGMAGAGLSVSGLGPTINPPHPPPGLEAHETNASASLLGQFRTNVSSWLWVRTDLYLHNGVEMRPLTDEEQRKGVTAEAPCADGHEELKDEGTIVTVVPPKERDFRGVFGDVERAVAAYKDMHGHDHNDPKMAMPLFRLMTWIDPQFVPGWTTGAMVLSRDKGKAAQLRAVNYLRDGLAENPNNVEILTDLGRLSATHLKDNRQAVGYLVRAAEQGTKKFDSLSETERDALLQTFRWLAICLRDLEEPEREEVALNGALRYYPDDPVLLELLYPPPSVLTPVGRERWFREKAALHGYREQ